MKHTTSLSVLLFCGNYTYSMNTPHVNLAQQKKEQVHALLDKVVKFFVASDKSLDFNYYASHHDATDDRVHIITNKKMIIAAPYIDGCKNTFKAFADHEIQKCRGPISQVQHDEEREYFNNALYSDPGYRYILSNAKRWESRQEGLAWRQNSIEREKEIHIKKGLERVGKLTDDQVQRLINNIS